MNATSHASRMKGNGAALFLKTQSSASNYLEDFIYANFGWFITREVGEAPSDTLSEDVDSEVYPSEDGNFHFISFFSSQCLEGLLNICILGFDIRMLLLMLLLDSFFFVFGFSDSVFREKDISIQIFGSEFFSVWPSHNYFSARFSFLESKLVGFNPIYVAKFIFMLFQGWTFIILGRSGT